jgi:transposase
MARFRRTTTKGNTYLQLVKSYRNAKGQPATKVLANLGNISNLSEEQIEALTCSFIKAVGVDDKFKMNTFRAGKGYHYGSCLPAIALWHELDLDSIIDKALAGKVKIAVSRVSLIQVVNRFSDPRSKLACFRWYEHSVFSQLKNFIHFPDDDHEKLHTYYRSLDYLCRAKAGIEQALYWRFKKHGMDSRLILYDITSVYFEGSDTEIGAKGHSRDHRPDADQIVIGLVMSEDGIPLAHHVFEGNRLDKTTVEEVIDDLEERFSIKEVIFVGDRGMLTVENINHIKSGGNNYILGMQRRNRRIIKYLMSEPTLKDSTIEIQEFTYEDLSEKLKEEYSEGVRFIACYNSNMAQLNQESRERNIEKFERLVEDSLKEGKLDSLKESYHKLKSYLSQYHMTRFYKIRMEKIAHTESTSKADKSKEVVDIYRLKIAKQDTAIEFEASLDGRYFIQTEVDPEKMQSESVVEAYKSLQKVERAFRVVKHDLDIRPVYVRKETRIRGHVMICYLALLIEVLLEKKLRELFPEMADETKRKATLKAPKRDENTPLTMMMLKEELDTIRLVPLYINDNNMLNYISTQIGNNVKKLFSSLGIKNATDPKNLRITKAIQRAGINQLELFLGE